VTEQVLDTASCEALNVHGRQKYEANTDSNVHDVTNSVSKNETTKDL
jgi:hypothetical protein